MIDARPAIAREWTEHLLGVTFTPPRGMSEDGKTEWARDCREAVERALPHREREALLALTDEARKRLREKARTLAWPTVSEVLNAIRDTLNAEKRQAEADGDDGWPHANSEFVVESTIKWISRFKGWPQYLEHPREVAREIVARTDYQLADLIRMGLKATNADARSAGIEWGPEPTTGHVKAMHDADFRS